jgi:autotransporter-associated beta strand protein
MNGGKGGYGSLTLNDSSLVAGQIIVAGGSGGQGGHEGTAGDGYAGGSGGNTRLTTNVSGSFTADELSVLGGNGGDVGESDSFASFTSGIGGEGGYAELHVAGILSVSGAVTVSSGETGGNGGDSARSVAQGGYAFFRVRDTLVAPTVDLIKQGGALGVNIAVLDVTAVDTAIRLANTDTGTSSVTEGQDGVYIGTARLGDKKLTAALAPGASSGTAYIGVLKLEGGGGLVDTGGVLGLGRLEIDGGVLNAANWGGLIGRAYLTTDDITLAAGGATVALGAGEDRTLSRDLAGSGSLTKTGAGTLFLTGANTYAGDTLVTGGTLSIASDGNIGGVDNILDGGTLLLTGPAGTVYSKGWRLNGSSSVI